MKHLLRPPGVRKGVQAEVANDGDRIACKLHVGLRLLHLRERCAKGEGWAGTDRQEANGAATGDPARPFNSYYYYA